MAGGSVGLLYRASPVGVELYEAVVGGCERRVVARFGARGRALHPEAAEGGRDVYLAGSELGVMPPPNKEILICCDKVAIVVAEQVQVVGRVGT